MQPYDKLASPVKSTTCIISVSVVFLAVCLPNLPNALTLYALCVYSFLSHTSPVLLLAVSACIFNQSNIYVHIKSLLHIKIALSYCYPFMRTDLRFR